MSHIAGAHHTSFTVADLERSLAFFRFDDTPVHQFTVLDHVPTRLKVESTPYPKAGDPNPTVRLGIVSAAGERIAVFRYGNKVSAVSNVCQHQNGPLGEGKIVGGCIVCPWHGYEYAPETGAAPPPFTEAVPTFRSEIRDGRVYVDPRPLPPGTHVPSAIWDPS